VRESRESGVGRRVPKFERILMIGLGLFGSEVWVD